MPGSSFEGPISRHINRRLSRPLARALTSTPITPNHISLASFLVALGALACFASDWPIAAGVLIQTSSIVDGADGDLARLQGRESRFGAVFDATLDRYADAAIAGGMAWWAWAHADIAGERAFAAGAAALVAFLVVSYSRARMEQEGFEDLLGGPALLASRDVRLLLAAIGSAAGQAYWTLVLLGAISYLVIAWRLLAAYARQSRLGRPA